MVRKFLHKIYFLTGKCYNLICRFFWSVRDKLNPPKNDSILFVAHPDDDVLFFHTFIQKHNPYVVLLTGGWSFRRMSEFKRAMKYYKVRYKVFGLHTRDKRVHLLEKYVIDSLKISDFKMCVTHNREGEYGHEMHIRVHDTVSKNVKCCLLVPECHEKISCYPLDERNINEKLFIFKNFYKTQVFVLDEYKQWVINEKLIKEE